MTVWAILIFGEAKYWWWDGQPFHEKKEKHCLRTDCCDIEILITLKITEIVFPKKINKDMLKKMWNVIALKPI